MTAANPNLPGLKIGNPTSMNERQKITENIVRIARRDPDLAFEKVSKIIEDQPNEYWTWLLRSYVSKIKGDLTKCKNDIDTAISIDFNQPDSHQEKAIVYLNDGNFNQAIYYFTNAIEIGEKIGTSYYESYCRFLRAFCYCKIGDFIAAELDLSMVDDEDSTWIDRLRTKAELLEACRKRHLD